MNKELKQIFGDAITANGKTVPVAHLRYKGKEKNFVVWCITSERGELYADDALVGSVVSVDVDVYSNGNYVDVVTEIKRLMFNADWIWVEDGADMYEDETALYHKTLTFEKEGE